MFRQSPRKNQRSGGMKTKHVLQIGLVLGVVIWLFVHGSDKKASSQQNPKFSQEKMQQYENDKVIKLGRKDLKPKKDAFSEDEKLMDVHPQERSQFDDETKPVAVEEQVNNMGTIEHIENYVTNLKETEGGVTQKAKDGEVGILDKVEGQENNLGTDELMENFTNNMKETETEEGGVAKEGKDGEMGTLESDMEVQDGRGNENENQSSDDQKMDGGEKDVTNIEGGDNFNKIDDKKFEEENNKHDAGKYDGEHIESEGASIKMKKHGDVERGQQKMEAVNVSKEGETTVDNDGKGNEFGETIDGSESEGGKSEGTLEENANGDSKIADKVENENKIANEFGELMIENQSKESTNNVIKEENKGKGKVGQNSQKSSEEEVSMEQKVGGNMSENSQKSGGDELSIEHKVAQESDGIKGKGDEEGIGKNNKVGKKEDVLNEKTSLPEGKIIDTSEKSSKNIQESNPDAEVASDVTVMTSKNGTEIEKGSSSEPEKTKSKKKKVKNKNSNHTQTLTTGNENEAPNDEQQHMQGSTEKLNTNDVKSNLSSAVPSTKVKVANGDSVDSNDIESVAEEGQNAEPKTSQAMADSTGMEERQKAEPKTSQITADRSGMEERQNAESKIFQDKADRSGATQGQNKSSINEINDFNDHLKSRTDTKPDEINNLDVSHTSTDDTKPDENLASVSDSDAFTQRRIKNLSHVTSSSNAEETETLSHDTSSSNGDETAEETSKKTAEETPDNEADSSSGLLAQEEEDHTDLDTLPESVTSNNNTSE